MYKKISNINKIPMTGTPNSVYQAPNGNKRYFGPDGRALTDEDHIHPNNHPNLKNPHYHDWDWSSGDPVRSKPYNKADASDVVDDGYGWPYNDYKYKIFISPAPYSGPLPSFGFGLNPIPAF